MASEPSWVAGGGCGTHFLLKAPEMLPGRSQVCRQGPGCRTPRQTERDRKDRAGPFTGIISSPQAERMRNLTIVPRPREPKAAAKEGRRKETWTCS